ncbi:MAG TPA: hypothetical protein P5262_00610 [Candidatus Moranbacteria bacterium]|nr:hypothetical protein [Candidatus Moranbacteria bacterium]
MNKKTMKLQINIKDNNILLVLEAETKEKIDKISFPNERNLTEKLLVLIDNLVKRNKLEINDIKNVKVKSDMADSFTTARIAKVTANIINQMKQ